MAKKYLLYIHNDKFDSEPQKSALINLLLDRHYDFFKPGTLIEDFRDDPQFDASVVGNAEVAEILKPSALEDEINSRAPVKAGLLDKAFDNGHGLADFIDFKPCKHGADPTLCKYRKNGKPCK